MAAKRHFGQPKIDRTKPLAYCATCDDEVNVEKQSDTASHRCIHCGSNIEESFVVLPNA